MLNLFSFFFVFWEKTSLAVNPDVPAQQRWYRLNWTSSVKGVSNICTHVTAIAISQYLSVTAVLSQCWCFYNLSCFERKILGFPFPTALCRIFRVRVRIQNSTKVQSRQPGPTLSSDSSVFQQLTLWDSGAVSNPLLRFAPLHTHMSLQL